MSFSLPSLAMKRPVTVAMTSITFLILGVIAWRQMPLRFLPDADSPLLYCSIPYPGSYPAQVEREIAVPAEGLFRTVPGIDRIETTSSGDGCGVLLLFTLDTDMDRANAEARDRIERLRLMLPPEVERIMLQRFNVGTLPVLAFGLFKEGDQEDFTHTVRKVLVPRLSRVEGVANVNVQTPVPENEAVIEFDHETLLSLNLSVIEVIQKLQASSVELSMGTLTDSSREYLVRTAGAFRDLDDLRQVMLNANGLRLKDVAHVGYRARDEEMRIALDGKPGVVVTVMNEPQANTVATCQAARAELLRILEEPLFREVDEKVFLDQAELITGALGHLKRAGMYGGLMALLVLFVFLHRIGPTIVVALSIPTSLVVALVFMYFAGMSLNLLSMVSLIIALGMLVDNAIVVTENIVRRRRLGEDRATSSVRGARDVAAAILAATATTAVVFVPTLYMEGGEAAVFMRQLGLPLIVSLGASLVIALTLIPLAMSHLGPKGDPTPGRLRPRLGRFARLHPIEALINGYGNALAWMLRRRLIALLLLALFLGITFYIPSKRLGFSDTAELDMREVMFHVEMDSSFDMDRAAALFDDLEGAIGEMRADLGIKNQLGFHSTNFGTIELYLEEEGPGAADEGQFPSSKEVFETLKKRIPEQLPGAEIKMDLASRGGGGGGGGIALRVRGLDSETLRGYARQVQKTIKGLDSVAEATTDLERQEEEVRIHIDQTVARKVGIPPSLIAQTLLGVLRGARLPDLKQGGREIPVWVEFFEREHKTKANVGLVNLAGPESGEVPLNQLVDFSRAKSPGAIRRVNGRNVVTVEIEPSTKDLAALRKDIQRVVDTVEMPTGYSIEFGAAFEGMAKAITETLTAFGMALLLIYLVMSAVFESYVLPLSVLTSVPMAAAGAVWILYLTGTHPDATTLLGGVLMVGIIVNNAIVIVDHINRLRGESPTRNHAIVQGGRDRFRPVLMTAGTTILGLLPLALAQRGGAASFAGLGRALIGGLTAGTLLTLFVVPLFYSLLDDAQRWSRDFLSGLATVGKK